MTVKTTVDLTAAQLGDLEFRKALRENTTEDLEDNTRYAVVLLKLHPTVTPDDYPTLKAAMIDVPGIQDVTLLFDRQTKATMPANHVQTLHLMVDYQKRDDTPKP